MNWQQQVINWVGLVTVVALCLTALVWVYDAANKRFERAWRAWNSAREHVGVFLACRYRIGAWLLEPYLQQRWERLSKVKPEDEVQRIAVVYQQIALLDVTATRSIEPRMPLPPIDLPGDKEAML